jgi:hypothetical protein
VCHVEHLTIQGDSRRAPNAACVWAFSAATEWAWGSLEARAMRIASGVLMAVAWAFRVGSE